MNNFQELLDKKEELLPELKKHMDKMPSLGSCLRHPLVFGVPYTPMMNALYNEQFRHKQEVLAKAIQEKNWGTVLYLHERPYRFEKFFEYYENFTDKEYWELLGSIWTDSENLWQYNRLPLKFLEQNRPGKENLMDEEEHEFLKKLPEQFVVYRGHQYINRNGYSFSLSYSKAKWFAQRFSPKRSGVISALCNRADVLAVFLGRGEFEIVVNPEKIKIQKTPKIIRPEWLEKIRQEAIRDFKLSSFSHHGHTHWEKVERNAAFLAKKTPQADPIVAATFAVIHDSKRILEDDDPKHGQRASNWAKALFDKGKLPLTELQLKTLLYACDYHNDGTTSSDPTIGVCWDADRLDLPRVGIAPEAKYLSTDAGKNNIWKI